MNYGYESNCFVANFDAMKKEGDHEINTTSGNFNSHENYDYEGFQTCDQYRNTNVPPFFYDHSGQASILGTRASFLPPPPQEAEDRLKKKRERNRIAATKCRQRKIEKIFTLEDEVKKLSSECKELSLLIDQLKRTNDALQEKLQQHQRNGCFFHDQPSNQQTAMSGSKNNFCLPHCDYGQTIDNMSDSPSPLQYGPDSTSNTLDIDPQSGLH